MENKKTLSKPAKKPTLLEKYKNPAFLKRFNVPIYAPLAAVLIMFVATLLAVYFIQKPTGFKSKAQNPNAVLVQQDNEKLKALAGSATPAELAIIAQQRKELMLKLAKQDPQAFLDSVLDQDTLNKLPQVAKDAIEKKQTLEGAATKLIIDGNDKSQTEYWLDEKTTNKRYYLTFTTPNLDITTGPQIKADAYVLDDKAVSSNVQLVSSKTLGASTAPFTRNILAIRVLLSDNKTQSYDTTATQGYISTYTASARAFHNRVSYGIVNFATTLTPYLTVSYTQNDACTNYGGPIQTAVDNAATAAGYNLSNYQNIIYLYPHGTNCPVGVGTVGPSPSAPYQMRVWYFNYTTNTTYVEGIYAHELGHNLGLGHASTLKCTTKVIDVYSNCTVNDYGNSFDTLGYNYTYYPEENGPNRYLLGYFSAGNVINISQPGTYTYTISNIETNTTSPQIIRIPKSTGDYYYLDYRRPLNTFDSDLPAAETGGADLYVAQSNGINNDYRRTYLLDTYPSTAGFDDAAFVDGRSFSDAASYLTVKQVSHTTTSVTLTLTYTRPTPTPSPTSTPTPTPTPKPTSTPTPSPTVTPIPDNTSPTISITSPLNGSLISKNSNVTITANATDNIGISQVQFSINGGVDCTDTTSPYTCSFKATGRLGNSFNITVTAFDKSNNKASATIVVTSN